MRRKRPNPKLNVAAAQHDRKPAPVRAVSPLCRPAPLAPAPAPTSPHFFAPSTPRQPGTATGRMAGDKKAAPAHPPYSTMIAQAIKDLKERSGSSAPAICKQLGEEPEGGGGGPGLATSRCQRTLPRAAWPWGRYARGFAGLRQARSCWRCRRGRRRPRDRHVAEPQPPHLPPTHPALPAAEKTYGNKLKDGIMTWHKQARGVERGRAAAAPLRATSRRRRLLFLLSRPSLNVCGMPPTAGWHPAEADGGQGRPGEGEEQLQAGEKGRKAGAQLARAAVRRRRRRSPPCSWRWPACAACPPAFCACRPFCMLGA